MKTHSTHFNIPGLNWKIKVLIHPTQQSLNYAYGPSKDLQKGEYIMAFCEEGETPKNIVLHFTRKSFTPEIIAHEGFHAVVAIMKGAGLNVESDSSEELLAEAQETIVTVCLLFKQTL